MHSSIVDLTEQLFRHPYFLQTLQNKIQSLTVHTRISESGPANITVGQLTQDIFDTVSSISRLSIQDEWNVVRDKMQQATKQTEKELRFVVDGVLKELQQTSQSLAAQLRNVRANLMDCKIGWEKQQSVNTFSLEALTNRIRSLQQACSQLTNLDQLKAFSSSYLEEPEESTAIERTSPDKYCVKPSQCLYCQNNMKRLEDNMLDLQARLQQKYEINMRSLWNVMADIESRSETPKPEPEKQKEKLNKTFSNSSIEPVKKRRFGWL